jgi:hypothetical protein
MAQLTDKRMFLAVSSLATPDAHALSHHERDKETYWTKVSFDTFVCRGGHSAEPAAHFRHYSAKAAGWPHGVS